MYPKTFLHLLFSFCSWRWQQKRDSSINSSTFVSCLDLINLISAYLCPRFCQISFSLWGSFLLSSSIFCIWTGAGTRRQPYWRPSRLLITLQGSLSLAFFVSAWVWREQLGPCTGHQVKSVRDYLVPRLWLYPCNKIGFITKGSLRIANQAPTKTNLIVQKR